jgi:hypothetical protein
MWFLLPSPGRRAFFSSPGNANSNHDSLQSHFNEASPYVLSLDHVCLLRARSLSASCSIPGRNTHQSPMWIKALEGGKPLRPLAQPQPQKIFGTRPCPNETAFRSVVPCRYGGPTPTGSRPGRIPQTRAAPGYDCGWDSCQSGLMVMSQHQSWFTVPAILTDQSTSQPRRALDPAARKSRTAPVCAPLPYELPRSWFEPSCADKSAEPLDHVESQSSPPR